jgi:hypothetical protein
VRSHGRRANDNETQRTGKERLDMDTVFHSLHDFMLRTESITYILIVAALIGITGFWLFLSDSDDK